MVFDRFHNAKHANEGLEVGGLGRGPPGVTLEALHPGPYVLRLGRGEGSEGVEVAGADLPTVSEAGDEAAAGALALGDSLEGEAAAGRHDGGDAG